MQITKELFLQNAKTMVFPYIPFDKNVNTKYNFDSFLKDRQYIKLPYPCTIPGKEEYYVNDKNNLHHFTTQYHYDHVLPVFKQLFRLPYNSEDFYKIQNVTDQGDYSLLIPKSLQKFGICVLQPYSNNAGWISTVSRKYGFETSFSLFLCDQCESKLDWICTSYHTLFKYSHLCTCLFNTNPKSNRVLVVSCDSHIIPTIPILTYYYETVIILDNRFNVDCLNIFNEFVKDADLKNVDFLLMLWENNSLERYIENNLS